MLFYHQKTCKKSSWGAAVHVWKDKAPTSGSHLSRACCLSLLTEVSLLAERLQDAHLPDAGLCGFGKPPHHLMYHRHLPIPEQGEALCCDNLLQDLLGLGLQGIVIRKEHHAHTGEGSQQQQGTDSTLNMKTKRI